MMKDSDGIDILHSIAGFKVQRFKGQMLSGILSLATGDMILTGSVQPGTGSQKPRTFEPLNLMKCSFCIVSGCNS